MGIEALCVFHADNPRIVQCFVPQCSALFTSLKKRRTVLMHGNLPEALKERVEADTACIAEFARHERKMPQLTSAFHRFMH